MTISVPVKFEIKGDKIVASGVARISGALDKTVPAARRAQTALKNTETAARGVRRGFLDAHSSVIAKYLPAIGSAALIRTTLGAVNALGNMENQLRLVTDSTEEMAKAKQRLLAIANESYSSLFSVGTLYSRIARAAETLGRSEEELYRVTELTTKAVALSGATAQESSAGLIQFAQGLASNRLQGDELRSVLENLPGLARAIASGLGVTIGEIRELAAAGKLTADEIIEAILSQGAAIEESFGKFTPTVAQSWETMTNNAVAATGAVDNFFGSLAGFDGGYLSNALQGLAEGFELIRMALAPTEEGEMLVRQILSLTNRQKEINALIEKNSVYATAYAGALAAIEQQLADTRAELKKLTDAEKDAAQETRDNKPVIAAEKTAATLEQIERDRADAILAIVADENERRVMTAQRRADKILADAVAGYDKLLEAESISAKEHEELVKQAAADVQKIVDAAHAENARRADAARERELAAQRRHGDAVIREIERQLAEEARKHEEAVRRAERLNAENTAYFRRREDNALEFRARRAALSPDKLDDLEVERDRKIEDADRQYEDDIAAGGDFEGNPEGAEEERRARHEIAREEFAVAQEELLAETENLGTMLYDNLFGKLDEGAPASIQKLSDELRGNFKTLFEGKNSLSDIGDSFKDLAADALVSGDSVAEAVEKQIKAFAARSAAAAVEYFAVQALDLAAVALSLGAIPPGTIVRAYYGAAAASGGGGGTLPSNRQAGGGRIPGGFAHDGAIVGGTPTFSRSVPTAAFAGAPRFHGGGIAGLNSDEVPIIARRGEGVFTPEQMSALSPAGQGGASMVRVEIINESGTPLAAEEESRRREGPEDVVRIVARDIRGGGETARAITGRFGLRERGE